MEKEDHHYVPQVYLRQFLDLSKKLWRCKVNSKHPQRPKQVTTAQVCYEHDFYKIDFKETLEAHKIDSPLFLEKKGLKQFEDRYVAVIQAIQKRESFIFTKHARFFLKGLLLIKLRNQSIRTTLLNSVALKDVTNRVIERMKPAIQKLELQTRLTLLEGIEKRKEEFLLDERSKKDMHLRILLDDVAGGSELTEEIITFLMNSHWYIFTASPSDAFICSDNPGHCITGNEQIYSLKFSGTFTFCFPLTPSHALIIMSLSEDKEANEFSKAIHYRATDASLVTLLNRGTIALCNRDIFSNEEEVLERVMADFKKVTKPR